MPGGGAVEPRPLGVCQKSRQHSSGLSVHTVSLPSHDSCQRQRCSDPSNNRPKPQPLPVWYTANKIFHTKEFRYSRGTRVSFPCLPPPSRHKSCQRSSCDSTSRPKNRRRIYSVRFFCLRPHSPLVEAVNVHSFGPLLLGEPKADHHLDFLRSARKDYQIARLCQPLMLTLSSHF